MMGKILNYEVNENIVLVNYKNIYMKDKDGFKFMK